MVNVNFQLDKVWNHLGAKPIGTSVRVYLTSEHTYARLS